MDRWHHLGDRAVCTSALCLAEVKQGLEYRQSKKYWRRYEELLEGHYPILSFDENTPDLLIAATAKQHGLILATLNAKAFEGIPGLAMEDWG